MTEYFRHIILWPLNIFSTCCRQNTYQTHIVAIQFNRNPSDVSVGFAPATYRFNLPIIIQYEESGGYKVISFVYIRLMQLPQLLSLEEVRNREVEGIVVSLAENNMGLMSRNE